VSFAAFGGIFASSTQLAGSNGITGVSSSAVSSSSSAAGIIDGLLNFS
jgi:hypothetical protein